MVAALLAVASGPAFAQTAGREKASSLRLSSEGTYSIRMVQGPEEGACRVEVLREGQPHWTLKRCVGTADDLYFVSADGERFWVLYPVPKKGKGKAPKRLPRWTSTVVAVLYDRDGNVLKQRRLHEFVRSARGLDQVRHLAHHLKWLGGVVGVPGKPPVVDEDGAVALETVELKTFKLRFKE